MKVAITKIITTTGTTILRAITIMVRLKSTGEAKVKKILTIILAVIKILHQITITTTTTTTTTIPVARILTILEIPIPTLVVARIWYKKLDHSKNNRELISLVLQMSSSKVKTNQAK